MSKSHMNFDNDDDLTNMTREALVAEVKKLRQGIRIHRDSTGQDLCWHHRSLDDRSP